MTNSGQTVLSHRYIRVRKLKKLKSDASRSKQAKSASIMKKQRRKGRVSS